MRFYSCEEHEKAFVKDIYDAAQRLVLTHFACGCVQEARLTDALAVGDAVLHDGDLFRIDGTLASQMGDVALLSNVEGETAARWHELIFVAADKLSGLRAKNEFTQTVTRSQKSHRFDQKWDPVDGYAYADPDINEAFGTGKTAKPAPKPTGPTDSISTGSLIKKEIKKLEGEVQTDNVTPIRYDEFTPSTSVANSTPRDIRPLRTKSNKSPKQEPPKEFKSSLPKRKGDW